MNKDLLKSAGFGKEVEKVEHGFCPLCSQAVDGSLFVTELDKKEYKISGICKPCQDNVFGGGGE